ncbi:MAG: hypothetical protein MUC60_14690 [Oscillatoria sp. Prado101]|jgi:hypothetical protein|nr:hypothetical protein [Oscillatoria sp. Prado101]
MSHLSVKSITFYAVAIGSVALLFKVVSAYGETNLKAPPPIAGRYRTETAQLPGCNQSEALVLTILQSGVYLNGSLQPASCKDGTCPVSTGVKIEDKPVLSGRWDKGNLTLAGSVSTLALCPEAASTAGAASRVPVTIQGKIEGETLLGQITIESRRESFEFSASREASVDLPENH